MDLLAIAELLLDLDMFRVAFTLVKESSCFIEIVRHDCVRGIRLWITRLLIAVLTVSGDFRETKSRECGFRLFRQAILEIWYLAMYVSPPENLKVIIETV